MHYKIILPDGKLRGFCVRASAEYVKRLRRYCHMQIQPQKEFTRRRAPTEKWIGVARAGRSLSSEQFAEMIQAFAPDRFVSFFIGLKSPAGAWDETLSLTSAELSWDLLPVVLLEQIYRAYRIIHHEPYHK